MSVRSSESGNEITSRTVTENCEYSQRTVQRYLNELVRVRLLLRDESQREYRYNLIEEKDGAFLLNLQLFDRFTEKELENWLSNITTTTTGVRYEDMKANIYNPLPDSCCRRGDEKVKEGFSYVEKAKNSRSNQNTLSFGELEETLRKLAKLFCGLVPVQHVIKELKAKVLKNLKS